MKEQDLLDTRRAGLASTIAASAGDKPHLDAFAARLLGPSRASTLLPHFEFVCPNDLEIVRYEGFPRVAHIGFALGAGVIYPSDVADTFLADISRLQHRQGQMLQSLSSDDIALLGLCEGVAYLRKAGSSVAEEVVDWLVRLVDGGQVRGHWLSRVRSLGGDLLDASGRLLAAPTWANTDTGALELALRHTWTDAFASVRAMDDEERIRLLASLLSESPPRVGDLERAVVWLCAIDALVTYAARGLTPSISDTVRILQDVQHSLKRWRPHDRARRKGLQPGTWLIDDEYDVQTLLWAVLYPIFGSDLIDETHLPNWGFTEPRLDLGIQSLGVIIAAKIARNPSDFNKIEGEIHGDLGLYFKDPSKFDKMIVFIYDDCDRHEPEKIDGLKNALIKRSRIEGVVVVRRPSVMPGRKNRNCQERV